MQLFPKVLLDSCALSWGCSRQADPGRTTIPALPRHLGLSPSPGLLCHPRHTQDPGGGGLQPPRTSPSPSQAPQKTQDIGVKQVNALMRGCFPPPGWVPSVSKDKKGEQPPSITQRRLRPLTGTKGRLSKTCQRTAGLVLPWVRGQEIISVP